MRILVLQLARFGDIYQTWPTLNAIKRLHPEVDVHLLVRERFQGATVGLEDVTVHAWPTAAILQGALGLDDEVASGEALTAYLTTLEALEFDQVINLSFSPVSSFICDYLETEVRGYTRHADGFLNIVDDTSAYFYAQAGIGRDNRYHVTELFAAVAGVDLVPEDFRAPNVSSDEQANRIVVQVGASQIEKTYPGERWLSALGDLRQRFSGEIVLIGSADEMGLAETVIGSTPNVTNRVGETRLEDLFGILSSAKLLIAADSAPIHIAALTQTPVLNLSAASVNFWETGPRTPGSRVLFAPTISAIPPERVVDEALALIDGKSPLRPCYVRDESSYRAIAIAPDAASEFRWDLVQALYTGTSYPEPLSTADRLAMQRLFELSELALDQIALWPNPRAVEILGQVDQLLMEVEHLNPNVRPLVQWFQTERLRLPPAAMEDTREATAQCFGELRVIASVYHQYGTLADERARARALCEVCAPALREYDFAAVEGEFQALVATLHEIARQAPGERWAPVLGNLDRALQARDFVELADRLEFDLKSALTGP